MDINCRIILRIFFILMVKTLSQKSTAYLLESTYPEIGLLTSLASGTRRPPKGVYVSSPLMWMGFLEVSCGGGEEVA